MSVEFVFYPEDKSPPRPTNMAATGECGHTHHHHTDDFAEVPPGAGIALRCPVCRTVELIEPAVIQKMLA